MGFRFGFVSGFGAGYYLGARAGRHRYEQINRTLSRARRSPVVETATEKARSLVDGDGPVTAPGSAGGAGLPVVAPSVSPDIVATDLVATDVPPIEMDAVTIDPGDYSSSR